MHATELARCKMRDTARKHPAPAPPPQRGSGRVVQTTCRLQRPRRVQASTLQPHAGSTLRRMGAANGPWTGMRLCRHGCAQGLTETVTGADSGAPMGAAVQRCQRVLAVGKAVFSPTEHAAKRCEIAHHAAFLPSECDHRSLYFDCKRNSVGVPARARPPARKRPGAWLVADPGSRCQGQRSACRLRVFSSCADPPITVVRLFGPIRQRRGRRLAYAECHTPRPLTDALVTKR